MTHSDLNHDDSNEFIALHCLSGFSNTCIQIWASSKLREAGLTHREIREGLEEMALHPHSSAIQTEPELRISADSNLQGQPQGSVRSIGRPVVSGPWWKNRKSVDKPDGASLLNLGVELSRSRSWRATLNRVSRTFRCFDPLIAPLNVSSKGVHPAAHGDRPVLFETHAAALRDLGSSQRLQSRALRDSAVVS